MFYLRHSVFKSESDWIIEFLFLNKMFSKLRLKLKKSWIEIVIEYTMQCNKLR